MIKFFRQIVHGRNSLRGAAGILVITLLLSNVMGAARNYFLTRYLPIHSLDIYYAAFRLPDLIFNVLISGAIFSAFIPVFTEYLEKKDDDTAWHIANAVITLLISALIICLLILFALMPYIMHLVVPSFSSADQKETVYVARLFLISPFFFTLSYLFGGILNSFHRFVTYSLAPLIYNLAIIIGAAVFAPMYARGDHKQLTVVALSVIVGAALHMLIQWPSVRHVGLKFHLIFDFRHQAVRRIGRLMIPRSIGLGADQLMLVIFTALASALPGAVSYFNLANDIQTMPTVVFGTAFATAIFPSLASAASRHDTAQLSRYLTQTINIIVTFMIPATVGLILLRVGIVQVLLGFNLHHVINTANTLALFSVSLIASGLIPLFSRAFYALQDTRTPMYVSVCAIVVSIAVALLCRPVSTILISSGHPWGEYLKGAPGLALSFSVGSYLNASVLYFYLRRRHIYLEERSIFSTAAKVVFASLVMGVVIYLTSHQVAHMLDVAQTRRGMLTQVAAASFAGIISYLVLTWLLGVKEVHSLWQRGVKD